MNRCALCQCSAIIRHDALNLCRQCQGMLLAQGSLGLMVNYRLLWHGQPVIWFDDCSGCQSWGSQPYRWCTE